MERRIMMWVAIGCLFIIALFFTFKAGAAGNVVSAAQVVAPAAKTSAASYGGMVGGC